MSIQDILGPSGLIARRLEKYEHRRQQMEMAEAVERALAEQKHLMVEAPTGVGKSFAYLAPAIRAALADKECRVVVSTNTISLQEQLIHKDIPFLRSVMPADFSAVLVKGRGNYISLRRLNVARQNAGKLFGDDGAHEQLVQLGRWAKNTKDGSRSDMDFEPGWAVWDQVQSDSGNCLGKRCPTYSDCFYFKARRTIHQANLLVVNHALFFSDLAMRRGGSDFGILPKYKVVILDEAHTLEDIAARHLGLQITNGQVEYLLNRLYSARTQRGLLAVHGSLEALQQVGQTRLAASEFFDTVVEWMQTAARGKSYRPAATTGAGTFRVRQADIVADVLSEELKKLSGRLEQVASKVKSEEEEIEMRSSANRAGALADGVCQWLGQQLAGQVYWVETLFKPNRPPAVTLAAAPVDVGPVLREHLYEKVPTVVLTSATLTAGGPHGFQHFQQRLGLQGCKTMQLGSPFNYRDQVELHLFRNMPDPAKEEAAFDAATAAKIQEYVTRTQGRAFVLFTSYQMMQRLAGRLREWLAAEEFTLLSQGDGLPRKKMLDRFRKEERVVLFGVDSFWQGVDIPGEALSNVIITKLPFAAPDQPLIEARAEAIEKSGGNRFFDYQLPQAVIKLKQGFGRLIRRRTDKGIVVILDPRVITKGYGREFLQALPECRCFVDGNEKE